MSTQRQRRKDLVAALNTAMREVSGHGVLYSQAVAERLGINSTDLECLDLVVLRGPIAAGALAEATGLTTGAITGVIDRLERAGFARREPDPDDRRKVLVRAEPAVFQRIVPLFEPMQRAAEDALAPYGKAKLALLLDFFTRVQGASLAALSELHRRAPPKPGDAVAPIRRGRRGPRRQ